MQQSTTVNLPKHASFQEEGRSDVEPVWGPNKPGQVRMQESEASQWGEKRK